MKLTPFALLTLLALTTTATPLNPPEPTPKPTPTVLRRDPLFFDPLLNFFGKHKTKTKSTPTPTPTDAAAVFGPDCDKAYQEYKKNPPQTDAALLSEFAPLFPGKGGFEDEKFCIVKLTEAGLISMPEKVQSVSIAIHTVA